MENQQSVNKKIKLIWDFRGPGAAQTARHYEKHLREYALTEELALNISGSKDLSASHSISFLVVSEAELKKVRDSLLPNRGEIYED